MLNSETASMTAIDLKDHLLDSEKIIWSGRPIQGILFTGRDWLLIPFSLLWGGFAIFWESSVIALARTPIFIKLWGVPFVLVGVYLIFGRFLLDAWSRKRIYYAITNKRILISRSGPFGKLTAMNLNQLPEASLSESANGLGTIRFGQASSPWARGNGFSSWSPAFDPTPQFIAIENARAAFNQIQRATQSISH